MPTDFTKPCTCRTCGDTYIPSMFKDYYNSTTNEDGQCETCLISDAGLDPNETVTVIVD